MSESWERWNTHLSTEVEVEVLGHQVKLAQNPSSQNLGTTVWDSSIVLAKYLQKNARNGTFARQKVKSKSAIELGAGMGLGGIALALLGCDVLLTDMKEVLPLLRNNYERNISPSALRAMGSPLAGSVGTVAVQELDWAVAAQREALDTFDYVIAADCVYHEHLLEDLLATVLHVTNPRSLVLIVNEERSTSVTERFFELFGRHFAIRNMPRKVMDDVHQHPAIQIFQLKLLRKKTIVKPAAVSPTSPTQDDPLK